MSESSLVIGGRYQRLDKLGSGEQATFIVDSIHTQVSR